MGVRFRLSNRMSLKGRLLIQNCLSASLQLNFDQIKDDPSGEATYAKIQNGLVVYVCFRSEADEATVAKMVKILLEAKIWSPHTKADVLANCDVLLVPQATLGAKLKGKQVQFHGNCEKTRGLELWSLLVDQMKQNKSNVNVEHGTYGNRQVLCMDTDGPFPHVFDI